MTPQGMILLFPQRSLTYMGCFSQRLCSKKYLIRKTVSPLKREKHFKKPVIPVKHKRAGKMADSFIKSLTFLCVRCLISILNVALVLIILTLKVMVGVGNPALCFRKFSENQHAITRDGMCLWLQ